MDTQIIHTEQQLMVLNKFRKRLEREKYINNYASNYYGAMQHRFTIPGILITGVCSVASFLATSDMLNTDTKAGFSIGVGILTAGATILQSVSSSFGFGARKDAFQKSADAYDDLITKIEFEICNPNEKFSDFCNDLETAILKIKNDCAFLPPLFIMAKYEAELAKTHLRLEGSPSREETFEDMIIKQISNKKQHSTVSGNLVNISSEVGNITNPNSININNNTTNNTSHDNKSQVTIQPDTKIDINPGLNIQDLEYDETVEPVLFLDNGNGQKHDNSLSEV
jgi:hypothetical protein